MNLNGKMVLITGATGGIGQATCKKLADEGAILLMIARSIEKLDALKSQLPRSEEHYIYPLDISADSALIDLSNFIEYKQLHIDVIINNAGSHRFAYLTHRKDQEIQDELSLNLVVPIMLVKASLTWAHPPTLILNVGSAYSAIGYPGYSCYCAAKAGLHRFSEALNRELDGKTQILYLAPRATITTFNSPIVTEMNQKLGNAADSPEYVAGKVVMALQKEKSVHWLGWPEKLFVKLNQICPFVVSRAIAKQFPIIRHYLLANQSSDQQ